MDTALLWELIRDRGGLTYGWWYGGATLLAAILAVGALWFAGYALTRREETVLTLLSWLAPSTVPAILVLPSYYTSIALTGALNWMWETPPQRMQDLSDETLQLIAGNLDVLAMLGIAGAFGSLVLCGVLGLRLRHGPLSSGTLRQSPIKAEQTDATEVFGPRPGELTYEDLRSIEQKYGILKIRRGTRRENHYSIFPNALIGKKSDASIIIPDPIVSREHASFVIQGEQTMIVDNESKNGTYIKRGGSDTRPIRVTTNPVALQNEDLIYLGHPSIEQSVEILFLHPQATAPVASQP